MTLLLSSLVHSISGTSQTYHIRHQQDGPFTNGDFTKTMHGSATQVEKANFDPRPQVHVRAQTQHSWCQEAGLEPQGNHWCPRNGDIAHLHEVDGCLHLLACAAEPQQPLRHTAWRIRQLHASARYLRITLLISGT